MTDELERRIAARSHVPSAALRARVVSDVRRRNMRERIGWIVACAAVVLAAYLLRALSEDRATKPLLDDHRVEVSALTALGFAHDEAERLATVWSLGRVPHFAPWRDTGALSLHWSQLGAGGR